jgi:hypothetical protein
LFYRLFNDTGSDWREHALALVSLFMFGKLRQSLLAVKAQRQASLGT